MHANPAKVGAKFTIGKGAIYFCSDTFSNGFNEQYLCRPNATVLEQAAPWQTLRVMHPIGVVFSRVTGRASFPSPLQENRTGLYEDFAINLQQRKPPQWVERLRNLAHVA